MCDRIGIQFGAKYEDLVRELEDPDDLVQQRQLMMRKDDPVANLEDEKLVNQLSSHALSPLIDLYE